MTPLITSPFALPDHLAAKADPDLIAHDERHFDAIAESLARSITDLTARLCEALGVFDVPGVEVVGADTAPDALIETVHDVDYVAAVRAALQPAEPEA